MPEPRRKSVAAVAMICRPDNGRWQWLARWNKNWKCYYFIGGHKHDGETFQDCLVREIGEELGLQQEKDFVVSSQPISRLEYVAGSKSAKVPPKTAVEIFDGAVETHYTVELFDVRFVGNAERENIRSVQSLRWLSEEEIRAQRCPDGSPISETMQRILDSLHWQCPACAGPAG